MRDALFKTAAALGRSEVGARAKSGLACGALVMALVGSTQADERPDIVWMAGAYSSDPGQIEFSADGSHLMSYHGPLLNGTKVWRVADGTLVGTVDDHNPRYRAFAAPNGSQVAALDQVGGTIGGILRHRADIDQVARVYELYFNPSTGAVSPDFSLIAISSTDGPEVYLRQLSDGSLLHTLQGHTQPVTTLSFSPDGTLLATGSEDATIRLWQVSDGAPRGVLSGHPGPIRIVAIAPDGQHLVSAGRDDNTFLLWDLANPDSPQPLVGHGNRVLRFAFSPDGKRLISAATGSVTPLLWDLSNPTTPHQLVGHGGAIPSIQSLDFSSDGKLVCSAARDGTVRIWNGVTGTPVKTLDGFKSFVVRAAKFSPAGGLLATSCNQDEIKLWDTSTWELARTIGYRSLGVGVVAISADGTMAAASEGYRWDDSAQDSASVVRARIRQVSDGALLQTIEVPGPAYGPSAVALHDAQNLALGYPDGSIELWKVGATAPWWSWAAHAGTIACLGFTRDGTHLVSGGRDHNIHVWALDPGALVTTLAGHTDTVTCLAFSHDGSILATGSTDGTVRFWNVANWTYRGSIGLGETIFDIAFAPDDTRIAIGAQLKSQVNRVSDGALDRLWTGEASAIDFSPDGKGIITVSYEYFNNSAANTIHAYSVEDGSLLDRFTEEVHGTVGMRFTPDGKSLIYGRQDGTLLLARNPFAVVEPPVLSLSLETGTSTLNIAWPGNDAFVLQASATMEPASWEDVPESPQPTDTGWMTTLPISDHARFYRLRAE